MSGADEIPHEGVTPIAIVGAAGRMGRMLVQTVHAEAPRVGRGRGRAGRRPARRRGRRDGGRHREIGVRIESSLERALDVSDICIDFTQPGPTVDHARTCASRRRAMVIGTTGLSREQLAFIEDAARDIPIVHAPNMSVGVNLCFKLLDVAARALGDSVDIEIIEAHHRNKVDAPSGTAVRMGEIIAGALGRDLADCAVYGREGHTGSATARPSASRRSAPVTS